MHALLAGHPPMMHKPALARNGLLAFLACVRVVGGTPYSKPLPEVPQRVEVRKGGKVTVTVGGLVMKPGANLNGVDLAGADLRWVDLRRADLRRADLTGANLAGANLSQAKLAGALLHGADLTETILHKAETFGAEGADFRASHVHPFFSEEDPEGVGGVQLFGGLEQGGAWHDLLLDPSGNLFWLEGERGHLGHLSRSGAQFTAPGFSEVLNTRMFTQRLDGQGHLLLFGEHWLVFMDLQALAGARVLPPGVSPFRATRNRIPGAATPPSVAFKAPWGHLCLVWPQLSLDVERRDDGATLVGPLPAVPGLSQGPVLADDPGSRLWFVQAERRLLVGQQVSLERGTGDRLERPLAPGSVPDLLARADPGWVWTAKRGEDWVQAYPSGGPSEAAVRCRLPAGARVHQIAGGPDGNLWATDPGQDRIFRITAEGQVTAFPVPRGTHPAELLDDHHGRLLFTTLDGHTLGAIRAVASPGKVWPELPPELAAAGPSPEVQAEDHFDQLSLEDADQEPAFLQAMADEGPASAPAPEGAVEPEAPARETPPPPATPMGLPDVVLTPNRLRHILVRHASPKAQAASVFAPAFHAPEALRALLVRGLREAAAFGTLGRVRLWDRQERSYTLCASHSPVGTYRDGSGRPQPTRTFLVVCSRFLDRTTGRPRQGVVTAYPISPHF